MTPSYIQSVLVIGYGNPLRGDDGIGPYIVKELARLALPGVHVRIAHQLVPELANEFASSDLVIFVDAGIGAAADDVKLISLGCRAVGAGGHISSPETLLELARIIGGGVKKAWLMSVTGESFEMGEGLSELALRNVGQALLILRRLIEESAAEEPSAE